MRMGKTVIVIGVLFLCASIAAVAQEAGAASDRFFDSNGVRIRYLEQGEGPPVILIHGYTGNADRHFVNPGVFGNLAVNYRVIALDCRGHGKSDKPTDPRAYGPEMARDLVRLMKHLNIPRAHIVGYSMGAILAGYLLTTDADRFLSATFVAYHPVWKWTADDDREAEATARDLESDTPFRSLILAVSARDAPPPPEDEIRRLSQTLAAANDPKALAAYNRGRRALVVTDPQLAAVRVPTLGIIGSADPSVGTMKDLKQVMPGLSVVVIDGAAHGGERGVMRRPEFLASVREFLAAHRSP